MDVPHEDDIQRFFCHKCGKQLKDGDAHYVLPTGVVCVACSDKDPDVLLAREEFLRRSTDGR